MHRELDRDFVTKSLVKWAPFMGALAGIVFAQGLLDWFVSSELSQLWLKASVAAILIANALLIDTKYGDPNRVR